MYYTSTTCLTLHVNNNYVLKINIKVGNDYNSTVPNEMVNVLIPVMNIFKQLLIQLQYI